jgi:hypothetical protein
MLKLLERNVASLHQRLALITPPHRTGIPRDLQNIVAEPAQHRRLVGELQRLRGRVYSADGAIGPQHLSCDGRHQTPEDDRSWHLVIFDQEHRVKGCIWYLEHDGSPTLDDLRARHSPLATQPEWREKLRAAVNAEVLRARHERIGCAEVGGWAVAEDSRPADCLMLVLATYALSQSLGGALVMATATVRHSSAPILRRMGGASLEGPGYVVPSYFDPRYQCEMELLRFDTRRPIAKFAPLVGLIKAQLRTVPVIAMHRVIAHASPLSLSPGTSADASLPAVAA